MEAYGLLEADPGFVHGQDWEAAWRHAGSLVSRSASQQTLERMLEETRPMSLAAPEAVMRRGSGWGALERVRRERSGERPFCGPSLVFDDASLGPGQAPWLALLEKGVFPPAEPQTAPASYMIQEAWMDLLKASLDTATGKHWGAFLQLGVMHLAHDRRGAARAAWEQSLRHTENVWALRNLACLAAIEKRQDEAMERYRRAVHLAPDDWRLTVEYATCLVFFKKPVECLALIDAAPAATRRRNRVRMLRLWAVVELDQLDVAAGILDDQSLLEDAREGDGWTAELWYTFKAKCMAKEEGVPCDDALMDRVRNCHAPPRHIDYRMANTVQSLLG